MKLLLCFVVMSLSLQTFATTTKSNAKSTCYVLPERYVNAPYPPPNSVPYEICLESARFDSQRNTLSVSSRSNPSLFVNLQVSRAVVQPKGWMVVSEATLISTSDTSICGRAEEQKIVVSAFAPENGSIDPASIGIYIQHGTSPDTCHSPLYTTIYQYELK